MLSAVVYVHYNKLYPVSMVTTYSVITLRSVSPFISQISQRYHGNQHLLVFSIIGL